MSAERSGKLDKQRRREIGLLIHLRIEGYQAKGLHPIPDFGSVRYSPICSECGWHVHRDPVIGQHRRTCSQYAQPPKES